MTLSTLLDQSQPNELKLERTSLKDQTTDLVRAYIISGRIPPGTKLVERELAQLLGTSRMPVRDALMDLEREGLVVSKPNGRYVIELKQEDIENLYQVRLVLEKLAVEQAAHNRSPVNCAALRANIEKMRAAIERNDGDGYVQADLEAHQLIWQQARNPHLLKMLNSIVGPIFMFIASQTEFESNWRNTLRQHQELTEAICAGDGQLAIQCIEEQFEDSYQLSLRAFEQVRGPEDVE
jgi:DNA-binding GntR family transcriptional regulator